jgi:hypothetical protein
LRNVPPTLAKSDTGNSGSRNTEIERDSYHRMSGLNLCPHIRNVGFSEFGLPVPFPLPVVCPSALAGCVAYIFELRSLKDVTGVTAGRKVAGVTDFKRIGVFPCRNHESYSVRSVEFPSDVKLAVSPLVFPADPRPASSPISCLHEGPEPFYVVLREEWNWSWSAMLSSGHDGSSLSHCVKGRLGAFTPIRPVFAV